MNPRALSWDDVSHRAGDTGKTPPVTNEHWTHIGEPIPVLDRFYADEPENNSAVVHVSVELTQGLISLSAWDDGAALDADLQLSTAEARELSARLLRAAELIDRQRIQ